MRVMLRNIYGIRLADALQTKMVQESAKHLTTTVKTEIRDVKVVAGNCNSRKRRTSTNAKTCLDGIDGNALKKSMCSLRLAL